MEETFKRIPRKMSLSPSSSVNPPKKSFGWASPPDSTASRPLGQQPDRSLRLSHPQVRPDGHQRIRPHNATQDQRAPGRHPRHRRHVGDGMAQPLPSPRSSGADGADGHEHHRDRRQAGFLAALGILQVLPHADEIAALGMARREKKTGLKPEENLSLLRVISRQYMLKHTPSVQFPPQSSLL